MATGLPSAIPPTLVSDHERIDARSLALDRAMARQLREKPELLGRARDNVERWLETCSPAVRPVLAEWRRQLDAPLDETLALMESTSERAVRMRQSSPFAGMLPADERTAILMEFHDAR